MGGFLYKTRREDPDEMGAIASPYAGPLATLIRHGKVKITADEIKDKSKGDFMSKGLALVQVLWFLVQFFARIQQHLPITELELVTLAYTVLSFWTYFFWWDKPQNVTHP